MEAIQTKRNWIPCFFYLTDSRAIFLFLIAQSVKIYLSYIPLSLKVDSQIQDVIWVLLFGNIKKYVAMFFHKNVSCLVLFLFVILATLLSKVESLVNVWKL